MPSFKCIKFEKGVYFLLTSAKCVEIGKCRKLFIPTPTQEAKTIEKQKKTSDFSNVF